MRTTPYVELNEKDLRKYQLTILRIAKDVIKFCDDNRITYTLSGGSVLGAVRHGGFIPWDDDIDINIARKDYQKFVDGFSNEYSDKYYIQTPRTFPDLGILVTQVRKKGTVARRKYDWNTNPCGISIDIYIVDNVFDNKFLRIIQGTLSLFSSFLLSSVRTFKNRNLPEYIAKLESKKINYKRSKLVLGRALNIIPISFFETFVNWSNGLCKNQNSKFVTNAFGRKHFFGEMQERSVMMKNKYLKFEDTEFKVPYETDNYLTFLYGKNYMDIPPKEKREKHLFLELKYD